MVDPGSKFRQVNFRKSALNAIYFLKKWTLRPMGTQKRKKILHWEHLEKSYKLDRWWIMKNIPGMGVGINKCSLAKFTWRTNQYYWVVRSCRSIRENQLGNWGWDGSHLSWILKMSLICTSSRREPLRLWE